MSDISEGENGHASNPFSLRMLLIAVVVALALTLCLTGGMFESIVPQDSLGGRASLTALLILVTALSCWLPASGPRFGERVALTPLVALIGVLIVLPALAAVPVALLGFLMNALEPQRAKKQTVIDRFLIILTSQLGTGLVVHSVLRMGELPGDGQLSVAVNFLQIGSAAALTFGVIYLLGLTLLSHDRKRGASVSELGPNRFEWKVFLANETTVYFVGCPFALLLGLMFWVTRPLVATSIFLIVAATLTLVSRALIDRNMVRYQLRAMDRLTQQAAIGKSPSPDRFLTEFFEHCRKLILYDRASVWIYREEELLLEKIIEFNGAAVSFQPSVRRLGEELVGRTAERRRSILVDDARRDARHRYFALSNDQKEQIGPVSVMMLPLLAGGELVGCVEFERRGLSTYGKADRERIQSLAALVAMCLANNRLHQDVCQQAVTDSLTGLYNKRQILKTLADETARAHRYGHTLSVMMLDLDGFKKYNDTFGHMQGDVLLQKLAGLIKQSIRTSDIAGRYGGEEFIVVMPESGRDAAWVTAERIRAHVEQERFESTLNYEASIGLQEPTEDAMPQVVVVRKTISIGVATFPADGHDPMQVLARADEALYAAKNTGRNRVVLASYPNETQPVTMAEAESTV